MKPWVFLAILCLVTNPALADWPMFQKNAAHTGKSEVVAAQTNNLKWILDLGVDVSPFGGPSIGWYNGQQRIVVGADDGVYLISTSGTVADQISTPSPVETVVAITNNTLYFGAGDTLYAYQPTGRFWSQSLDQDITHVTVYQDTLYVCDEDRLYSVSLNGELYWQTDNLSGHIIYSAPAVDENNQVYVVSSQALWDDYVLYACHSDGSLWWSYDYLGFEGNGVRMTPTLDQTGNIYLATYNSSFWSSTIQSLRDNQLNWTHSASTLYSSPAYNNGVLYYGTTDGLEARDVDGNRLWRSQTWNPVRHSSPAMGADGTIYFGTEGGYFRAVASNGQLKWSTDVLANPAGSPAIDSAGTVYVTAGQSLFAFADQPTEVAENDSSWQISIQPNPCGESAVIDYRLSKSSQVSIRLYDLKGRLIKVLVDGQETGHNKQVHLSGLASGIYFIRIESGDRCEIRRVTVVK